MAHAVNVIPRQTKGLVSSSEVKSNSATHARQIVSMEKEKDMKGKKATSKKTWRRRLAQANPKDGSSAAAANPVITKSQVPSVNIPPLPDESLMVGRVHPRTHLVNQWEELQSTRAVPFRLSPPASIYGHDEDCIYSCRFAPAQQQAAASAIAGRNATLDGKPQDNVNATLVATTGQDGSARVWCIEGVDGEENIREVSVLSGHGHHECVRFCWGDGVTVRLVATSGADGTVALWDTVKQKVVERLPCGEQSQVYAGEFIGGHSTLFVTGYEDCVSLWDIQVGQHEVRKWNFLGRKSMAEPAWLPRGSGKSFVYGAHSLNGISISSGSNLFAVALSDGSACVVDVREGNTLPTLRWQAHERYICEVSGGTNLGSPYFCSNVIMTASGDGTVKLWDIRKVSASGSGGGGFLIGSPSEPINLFGGHQGVVYGASFISNDAADTHGLVTSWSADGTVRVWSALESNPTDHHQILYQTKDMSIHGFAFDPLLKFGAAVGSPRSHEHSGLGSQACWHLFKLL